MAWLRSIFSSSPQDLAVGRIGPLPLFPKYYVQEAARRAHMHVIGITGKGKSKLQEYCLFQDITARRGCILIDPHGDLAADVTRLCLSQGGLDPERVIYFEPTRRDSIIPFNVLATGEEPYQVAQRVVEAFRRTWPESLKEAPHFSNVATAALMTLSENSLTLIDMHRLLIDREWREQLLTKVTNSEVVHFFHERYDRWGREAPILRESTLNKVAAFAFNPHLRRVLGQTENHLNLRRLMDEGKVLLVDLGRCDGETRRLLGSLLVTSLEQAAMSRQELPPAKRRPYYAYIDEFQDFTATSGSSMSLAQILSECRKFGLHLTLAHQTLSQLSPHMLGALGNVQTRIIFGVDRRDAEWFAREIGQVDTEAIKDEPKMDTQHPLYAPLQEQWEEWTQNLKSQSSRQVLVTDQDGTAQRIWTIPIAGYTASLEDVEAFRTLSAQIHGIAHRERAEEHSDKTTSLQPPPSPDAIVPIPL
jgi:hypothetical protein